MTEDQELLKKIISELKKENEQLKATMAKYRRLAKVVQEADFWDFSLYETVPDDTWVAIDRRDYQKILAMLGQLDETRPWESTIEKRLRGG